jgi:hypothetical protein
MLYFDHVGKYIELAKEKYGPYFNVMEKSLDPDVVYKVGYGKRHDCHFLVDCTCFSMRIHEYCNRG